MPPDTAGAELTWDQRIFQVVDPGVDGNDSSTRRVTDVQRLLDALAAGVSSSSSSAAWRWCSAARLA